MDVDLRKNVHFRMSEMKADLVHGCRFLCRELFPEIRDDVLIPGGVFVWSHFIEGCEQYAPPLRCAPHPLPSRQIINTTPGWTSLTRTGPFVGGGSPSRQLAIGELHECFVRGGDYLQLHDEEGQMSACPSLQSRFIHASRTSSRSSRPERRARSQSRLRTDKNDSFSWHNLMNASSAPLGFDTVATTAPSPWHRIAQ